MKSIPHRDRAEVVVARYIQQFVLNNRSARRIKEELDEVGIGLWPVVDHITIRTLDVDRRAKEFLRLGFQWDRTVGKDGILEYDDWWAKVYRKPGLPAVFIDQAFKGPRGQTSVIPPWVQRFSDKVLHHIAIRVEDIERAVSTLKRKGVPFAGRIVGERGTDLRQIFTAAQPKKGHPFTVVELIERHRGYAGFSPPAADALMKSSIVTAKTR
jgi:catechol 2,3-dioxygenase-like lactoylglutathione lyase family enzyme